MINRGTGTSEIGTLSALLKQVQLDLDGEEMADLLWLATQMGEVEVIEKPIVESPRDNTTIQPEETTEPSPPDPIKPKSKEPAASAHTSNPSENQSQSQRKPDDTSSQKTQNPAPTGLTFKAPTAPGLRKPLALARALRPLMRKVPSQTKKILDEEETVTQFAENRILIPVLKPAPERWFDIALVIEKSRSIIIWQEIIAEFQKLTELQGAFRSVSIWSLQTDATGEIQLFKQQNLSSTNPSQQKSRSPKELLDPAGRRLILLISDCTSQIWHQGKIHEILKLWSNASPLAILQLFPERLWTRTAMGYGFPVQLNAFAPGVPNPKLTIEGLPIWEDIDVAKSITLPVVTLEPDSLKQWSRVVAGVGSTQTAGIVFDPDFIPTQPQKSRGIAGKKLTPEELVNRFQATASPTARRLAGLMATVPVSLPVVHLIQETLLQDSMQVHVAEVFMSGLLEPIENDQLDADINKNKNPTNNQILKSEILSYEFVEGVRDLLIDTVRTPDAETVLETVSQYIARKAGISIKNFAALLSLYSDWNKKNQQQILPFAKISNQVLRRLGGEYAALAEQLASKVIETSASGQVQTSTNLLENFPSLQTYNFEIANIIVDGNSEDNPEPTPAINLQLVEFTVATIEGLFRRNTELIINRRSQQAYGFIEYLDNQGNQTTLEIMQIPGGSFMMGTPESEKDSRGRERPQHQVTVPTFFMGKYPVTQAQWKLVASLPEVNRELKPDPSEFKGANRPVEYVSWYDAVEFCQRLSQHTGKNYRLPSEAEWEYACRAETTTPFHFGETITPELANYNGQYVYGAGKKGVYLQETTEVGSFGVSNAFGLYDMHGNVWEWCLDDWHGSYEGAPKDGSAWLDNNDNLFQKTGRAVLRGGCWDCIPGYCRSGYRVELDRRDNFDSINGFRLVCGVGNQ